MLIQVAMRQNYFASKCIKNKIHYIIPLVIASNFITSLQKKTQHEVGFKFFSFLIMMIIHSFNNDQNNNFGNNYLLWL